MQTVDDGRGELHVAVVGLEFGAEFVNIYQQHPLVGAVTIADTRADLVAEIAAAAGGVTARASLDEVLADPAVDAVHLVTGFRDHEEHAVRALEAGKHVACTVPMALTFEGIERIVRAQQRSGKRYMMMETAVYTREFLFVDRLVREGRLGTVSYARGTHFQDMTDWPAYWLGLPPLFYATHAVSPILRLLDARVDRVRAIGGGALLPENQGDYGNPFSVESALVHLEGRDTVVELTRSLYQLARPYAETFSIYGDRMGFEWAQLEESERPLLFTLEDAGSGRGRPVHSERVAPPDRADLLPEPLRPFTQKITDETHRSFIQGGGHGGSHPHLVHEFVSAVIDDRAPAADHVRAANWTATGLAAHASALQDGAEVVVPLFG